MGAACCGNRSKSEQLQNAMKKQGVWGEAVAISLKETIDTVKTALKEGKSGPPDPEKLVQQMSKALNEKLQGTYEKIWTKYDADKNGELGKDELEKMTKESLQAQQKFMPDVMEVSFREFSALALEQAKEQGIAPSLLDMMKEKMDKQFPKIKKDFTAKIDTIFAGLIKDYKKIAATMYNAMDVDKDGKVTKKEFLEKYQEASSKVVDPNKLMAQLKATS